MSKSRIIEKPFGMVDETVAEPEAPIRQVKVVGVQWLNVRDGIEGNKIGEVELGTVMDMLSNDGPWTEIKHEDLTGWVMTKYLEFL